jgi:hypothetical protein
MFCLATVLLVGAEMKAQPHLPIIQQMSKPVKADDLEFQVVSSTIWPMPAGTAKSRPESWAAADGESPLQIELQVTNHGNKPVQLLSILGTPILRSSDGKELAVHFFGNDHTCTPKAVSLEIGKSVNIKGFARLYSVNNGIKLWWEDEFGTNWWIEGLKPGKYLLRLHYNTRRLPDHWSSFKDLKAWLGGVRTEQVPIEIVDLKASPPAIFNGEEALLTDGTWQIKKAAEIGWKDDLEVMALADGTWQAPAVGKQTQVCLGFRMRTVEDWWVRIIPSIAMVTVKSAEGVELPSSATGAVVPVDAPQLLTLQPEITKSVAIPAILFHDGKTLTLAWADSRGRVQHVSNLKPGTYTVRYVIRTEKDASQYVSYWMGEIQPQPIMVEIKK